MKKTFILAFFSLILLSGFVLAELNTSQSQSGSGGGQCPKYFTCPDGSSVNYCNLVYEEVPITCTNTTNVTGAGPGCTSGSMNISCKCIDTPSSLCTEKSVCKDSDGGKEFYVMGATKIINYRQNATIQGQVFDDACSSKTTLKEGYCNGNVLATTEYECPNGCSEGACINKACSAPVCNGVYNTGIIDSRGCPIYKCPSEHDQNTCLDTPDNYWDQQTNKCFPGFSSDIIKKTCSDPDGGINKYEIAHTFGFRSVFADSRDQRIRTGGKDACISQASVSNGSTSASTSTGTSTSATSQSSSSDNEISTSNYQLIEHYCDESGFIQTIYLDCPNGCNEKGCIKGEDITETISCYFKNSNKEQKCYTSEDNSKASCTGVESCSSKLTAEKRDKVTWKSSCGGYQSTFQDGQDEKVIFDCSAGETNTTEILNKGFKNAYWQCYNGKEWKSQGKECKSAEKWKEMAVNFCNGNCKEVEEQKSSNRNILAKVIESNKPSKEKCGVNSFSVGEECYVEDESTICKGQDIQKCCQKKANINGNPDILCEGKWKIDDNKCSWVCKSESNLTDIPATICKDSCPADNKCYPFGYRKSSQFCSDSGSFVKQLNGDEKCENNFECSSNVCVSGQCISEGTIQKILNWFKRLFGKD